MVRIIRMVLVTFIEFSGPVVHMAKMIFVAPVKSIGLVVPICVWSRISTPSMFWMLGSTFSAIAELITSKICGSRSPLISSSFLVTWDMISLFINLAVSMVISPLSQLFVSISELKSSLIGLAVCRPLDSRSPSVPFPLTDCLGHF